MTPKEAGELLKAAYSRRRSADNRAYVRKLTQRQMRRLPALYKTEKAKGWRIVTDSILGSDATTGF